jgi:hypothetical protein
MPSLSSHLWHLLLETRVAEIFFTPYFARSTQPGYLTYSRQPYTITNVQDHRKPREYGSNPTKMSDSSEWLKVAIDANESSLEDLVRRLSDGSDNSNKALSMALLNQIRVLRQGAKCTFQLAQEHEAKMRTMADEQARVAQVSSL